MFFGDRAARGLTRPLLAGFLLGTLAGCGGPRLYPVAGRVVWEDGSAARELAGGLVVFESVEDRMGARADIQADGSFRLSTSRPGDGTLAGRHRVLVEAPQPSEKELAGRKDMPQILDPRFASFETSGLEVT